MFKALALGSGRLIGWMKPEKESSKFQDEGCNSTGVKQMWSQQVSSSGSCYDQDFCCMFTVQVQDLCD